MEERWKLQDRLYKLQQELLGPRLPREPSCPMQTKRVPAQVDQTAPDCSVCLDIPTGTHFQFRSASDEPLCFVIATMPP